MTISAEPLAEHADALAHEEYGEFLRLVREHPARTPAQRAQLEALLDEFADRRLDRYRQKWNGRLGEFFVALGCAAPGTSAEEFFTRWEWECTHRDGALLYARANLRDAAQTGAKLTNQYAAELVSIGWRADYTLRLQGLAQDEPESFFAALVRRAPSPDPQAPAQRMEQLGRLATRAGGFKALGAKLDSDYFWELWKAFSSGRAGEDVAAHALKLLASRV